MPFYEYQCSQCEHITEVLQNVGDDKAPACEKCGSTEMKKLMSVAGVQKSAGRASASAPSCPTCAPGGSCGI
jgi:putative FmdB family regulatory protein